MAENQRIPAVRSLVTFQDQLGRGLWADRHVEALSNDPKSLGPFMQLVECAKDFQQQQQSAVAANDVGKMRSATMRNRVCMCHAVCPDETMAWLECMRAAARAARAAKQAGGAVESSQSFASCNERRRQLERCTQWETTRLLHVAAGVAKDETL